MSDLLRPAQLVEAAARAAANGASSVVFRVRSSRLRGAELLSGGVELPGQQSLGDQDGDIYEPDDRDRLAASDVVEFDGVAQVSGSADEPQIGRGEMLIFNCGGVRVEVRTHGSDDAAIAEQHVTANIRERVSGELASFDGRTPLNPAFFYEGSQQFEVMLELANPPFAVDSSDAQLVMVVAHESARRAALDAGSPILFLQLPSAPFKPSPSSSDRNSGSSEAVRAPQALCLRMSIALTRGETFSRLRFLQSIGELANDWSLGLHVGDGRPGRVRGEWITVRSLGIENLEARKWETGLGRQVPAEPIEFVRPITFVGPARTGSTAQVLGLLRSCGVGLAGIAVSSMQEVAFINLLVPEALGSAPVASFETSLVEGLQRVLGLAAGAVVPDEKDWARFLSDLSVAHDYRVLVGESLPITFELDPLAAPRPLWLTWDVPAAADSDSKVLTRLSHLLKIHSRQFEILYARSRNGGNGRIRGRAKVSVTVDPPKLADLVPYLGRLSEYLERHLRSAVAAELQCAESDAHISVTWRERWLGTWEIPL